MTDTITSIASRRDARLSKLVEAFTLGYTAGMADAADVLYVDDPVLSEEQLAWCRAVLLDERRRVATATQDVLTVTQAEEASCRCGRRHGETSTEAVHELRGLDQRSIEYVLGYVWSHLPKEFRANALSDARALRG